MENVRPLRDRILLRRIEEGEQKVGGIIIPDSAKEKPLQAEVVAVGAGRILEDGKRVELEMIQKKQFSPLVRNTAPFSGVSRYLPVSDPSPSSHSKRWQRFARRTHAALVSSSRDNTPR